MSVFVVAVLMAGLGYYWGLQHREPGAARPGPMGLVLPLAIYVAVVALLFVPVAGTECARPGTYTFNVCEMVKRAHVAIYMIVAAGGLTGAAGAYFGGYRRARWWLLAIWPLPAVLGWLLT
ncbi:hypothetical protein RXV95_00995 [Novosphingobium sp. ZN18A2]|uniref:hypothetical protein n=1 Tax=Novosphingobium sp. ZN18A2 TaxID=3079861 RepID=UPI0030D0B0A7